ncbi:MAG: hypothetical protein EB060_04835 [Proteobacteria bacterium]|nr:hypothetical protein [Pseudomonadota bacterium]
MYRFMLTVLLAAITTGCSNNARNTNVPANDDTVKATPDKQTNKDDDAKPATPKTEPKAEKKEENIVRFAASEFEIGLNTGDHELKEGKVTLNDKGTPVHSFQMKGVSKLPDDKRTFIYLKLEGKEKQQYKVLFWTNGFSFWDKEWTGPKTYRHSVTKDDYEVVITLLKDGKALLILKIDLE